MEIDERIHNIPVGQIDEIEWLRLRQTPTDASQEKLAIKALGRSVRDPRQAGAPQAGPKAGLQTALRQAFSPRKGADCDDNPFASLPVGQLAPIRVIRYPTDLPRFGKSYGLVFGYRRLQAAKAEGIPAIQAQVIVLTAQEYQSPEVRLWLRVMGVAENIHREPLSTYDMAAAWKQLKEQYETLYPDTSHRAPHLRQQRDKKGQLRGPSASAKRSPFARHASRWSGVSERTIDEYIQIAEDINNAILDDLIQARVTKSAALALAKVPGEDQPKVLEALSSKGKPFTVENIETAAQRHLERKPGRPAASNDNETPPLPDLSIWWEAAKLCMDLLHRFDWSPRTRDAALPAVAHLHGASGSLYRKLCQEKADSGAGGAGAGTSDNGREAAPRRRATARA
jgi:hypothetical protein